jgi:hypothetical protein
VDCLSPPLFLTNVNWARVRVELLNLLSTPRKSNAPRNRIRGYVRIFKYLLAAQYWSPCVPLSHSYYDPCPPAAPHASCSSRRRLRTISAGRRRKSGVGSGVAAFDADRNPGRPHGLLYWLAGLQIGLMLMLMLIEGRTGADRLCAAQRRGLNAGVHGSF